MVDKKFGESDILRALDTTGSAFDVLRAKGIYYLTGEIEEFSLMDIHADVLLKHLDPNWNEDIQFFINSPGGDCVPTWALLDLLEMVRMDVRTVGIGLCASAGAILLASGTKGKRSVSRNTSIMIHQFSGGMMGNYAQLTAQVEDIRQEQQRHVEFWKTHSKFHTEEEVVKNLLTGADVYLTAEKALEFGIIDSIQPAKPVKPEPQKSPITIPVRNHHQNKKNK
jgi:ATP-dependent Clp protease protease subunit